MCDVYLSFVGALMHRQTPVGQRAPVVYSYTATVYGAYGPITIGVNFYETLSVAISHNVGRSDVGLELVCHLL